MKKLERWVTLGNTYNKMIDADEAFRVLSAYYHHRTETQANALREALGLVPEAVVRCKDCRYGYQFYDVQNGITDSWVECRNPDGLNRDAPEDGYCYCGERKDDE